MFPITTESSKDFQERIYEAFGGYKEFRRKIDFYLKAITRDYCDFFVERFGYEFITLRIHKPCKYRKGIKLVNLASFFGVSLPSFERGEYEAEQSDASPDSLVGGGGFE